MGRIYFSLPCKIFPFLRISCKALDLGWITTTWIPTSERGARWSGAADDEAPLSIQPVARGAGTAAAFDRRGGGTAASLQGRRGPMPWTAVRLRSQFSCHVCASIDHRLASSSRSICKLSCASMLIDCLDLKRFALGAVSKNRTNSSYNGHRKSSYLKFHKTHVLWLKFYKTIEILACGR